MQTIKLLTSMANHRTAWAVGQIVEVNNKDAERLIAAGYAELAVEQPPFTVEVRPGLPCAVAVIAADGALVTEHVFGPTAVEPVSIVLPEGAAIELRPLEKSGEA
jgi:hypothetical protein